MLVKKIFIQIGRVTHELIISGVLLWFYLSGVYLQFSPTLQTIALKATLTSLGFLHAHITRKIAFPAVSWGDDERGMLKLLCIALYTIFIYAYSHGG